MLEARVDEETLRKLWEVTIPGAELDELDPGLTYRPAAQESSFGSDQLPTVWITDLGLELQGVDDSMASAAAADRPPRSGQDSLELAPTLEGSGEADELLETQDPESAATIFEPPPSSGPPPDAGALDAATAAPPDALVYQLKEVIGKGGMGVVYRAHQSSLQRDVAVKTMQGRRSGRQWRDRFVAEAVVTGRLDHPNIVPVYDLGQTPAGEAMLAMKLVEGTCWKRLLRPKTEAERERAARLDREDHLRTLISVCNAVGFAHSRGLVHNDLKPDNVMLGEYGEVLVMDWGLAVDVQDDRPSDTGVQHKSAIRAPCGTPSYMAPELAEGRGDAIGPWTDVYLLGAVLYEVLTGRPPHRGVTFQEVVMAAVLSLPKPFPEDVPDELQAICLRAMARDPQQRYPSALELREAVEAYLEHRESLQISDLAEDRLAGCRREVAAGAAHAARGDLYEEFASVVAGFQQALVLWDGNAEARAGQQEARLDYATEALRQGDLGLASAQLDRASASPRRDQLRAQCQEARTQLEAEARRARRTRRSLVGALGVIFLAVSTGFLLVRSERDQAERERRQAVAERARADWEAQQASQARDVAEDQRQRAQGRLARSLTAEGAAMVRAGRWRAARERFLQARQIQRALGTSTLPAELGLWSVLRASRPPLFVLPGAGVAIAGLAFTADERLVGVDERGELRTWDRSTGRLLQTMDAGDALTCLAASPRDPDTIVAGARSGELLLWDLREPQPERLAGHQAAVRDVRFSREGARLVSAGEDGAVLRWDVARARRGLPYEVYLGHQAPVRGLDTFRFSWMRRRHATADHALSVDAQGRLVWWYVREPDSLDPLKLGRLYGVHGPRNVEADLGASFDARCLAITRDFPQWLAVGGGDHTVRVGLYTDGDFEFKHTLKGHSAPVTAVAWSPDGRHLVSVGLDDRLVVWDAESGAPLLTTRDHEGGAVALAISWRGDRVAVGSGDGSVRMWDLGLATGAPTGAGAGRELRPLPLTHAGTAAALSPDGSLAVVAEHGLPPRPPRGEQPPAESPVTIWDAETGRALATLHGHARPVRTVAFLAEGAEVLSADAGGTVRFWSIDDAFQLPRRTIETGVVDLVGAVAPGGRYLAVGGAAGQAALYDLEAPAEAARLWADSTVEGSLSAVAVTAGQRVLAGTERGGHVLWSAAAEGLGRVERRAAASASAVSAVALAPDGETYAVGDVQGRLTIWRAGEEAPWFEQKVHTDRIRGLAFSPGGDLLASAGSDGVWRLWSVHDARELRSFGEDDPGGSVQAVAFSGDGRRLITLAEGQAEIWDFGRARRHEALEQEARRARARLQDRPDDAQALATLGELYAFRGSLRTAVELLARARRAGGQPDLLQLARAHWELGAYGHALDVLAEAPTPSSGAGIARLKLWRQELERLDGEQGGSLGQERWFVRRVVFSPDSRLLASSGSSGAVDLWDVHTGLLIRRLRDTPGEVFGLAFSADGQRLVAADENGLVQVWAPGSAAPPREFETELRITDVVALNDGRVLTCDSQSGLRLWSPQGEPLATLPSELKSPGALAISADESLLAASGREGRVELWDLPRLERRRGWVADAREDVEALAFAPGVLLSAGWDRKVHVWGLANGTELEALAGAEGTIYGLAAAGGLVVVGEGNHIRAWDLASRRPVALRRRGALVFSVAASPDGRWLAGGTREGELVLTRAR